MIRLINVKKSFNRKKANEIKAIDNTSIELADKGLVTFLGNSGCGKTTLLNAIGGLDKIDSGDIFIDDEKLTAQSSAKKDEIRNLNIGYIFQNYNLIEDDTVYENVAMVLVMMGLKDPKAIETRVMYILKKVGIDKYKNRPTKMLSGGERQRVSIARALVKNPKIIIADEPTGNLDSSNTLEIMNIIKAISREKLVILVTHEKEIAEFYSSRIIEIVDGKIVNDRENSHDGDLDYRIENKIYLKDMPLHQEIVDNNIKVSYYSDRPEDELSIKIVVKNNNIYIETSHNLQRGLDTVEMVDEHYTKISKNIYEDYEFDYEKMIDKGFVPKYSSIFNIKSLLVGGFKKVFGYSMLKKILLLGFIFASMFVIYSVSNIAGITNVTDEEFVRVNQNYLTISTSKLDLATYEKYKEMKGIDYVLPGDSMAMFALPLDDYYQSAGVSTYIKGSLADKNMVDESQVIAGRLPNKNHEIAVDRTLFKDIFDKQIPQQIGLKNSSDFVGRTARLNLPYDYKVVGIVDSGSPSIYVDRSQFIDILSNQMKSSEGESDSQDVGEATSEIINYDFVKNNNDIEITTGSAPNSPYEALVSNTLAYEKGIGSTLDTKVNGKNLTIVGFYYDKHSKTDIYVSPKTAEYSYILSQKNITLSPVDKNAMFEELSNTNGKVTDNYASDREQRINSLKEEVVATILVSLIILIISLIEMYLMLRSSFLSRIKEVGVLRAIGLKKKDIYKLFVGEIIALTSITAIPAMGVMAYILHGLSKMPILGEQYMMNPLVFIISLGLVFAFNILAGLLPVFSTMRKTPAAILSRNDVN